MQRWKRRMKTEGRRTCIMTDRRQGWRGGWRQLWCWRPLTCECFTCLVHLSEPDWQLKESVCALQLTLAAVNKGLMECTGLTFDPGKCIWDLCWMNIPPTFICLSYVLQLFHFQTSILYFLCLAHLSNSCSASMFKAQENVFATIYLNPTSHLQKQTYFPLFALFLPCSWGKDLTCLSSFACPHFEFYVTNGSSKCVLIHVCNTNSMHHTVQMAVFFPLWLLQLNMSKGGTCAGHLYVWQNIE